MERKTFDLKTGNISFHNDQLIIKDDVVAQIRLNLFLCFMGIIYGVFSVLRYVKTGDSFLLWTGLLMGVGHLLILIYQLLYRSQKSIIDLHEIISYQFKNRQGKKILQLKLSNKKTRNVQGVDSAYEELKTYIDQHFYALQGNNNKSSIV